MENNLIKCPRFSRCSINKCVLDSDAELRDQLPGEEQCPFTIKKKCRDKKGARTLADNSVLEFVPKSNVKMLNRRNQKRLCG